MKTVDESDGEVSQATRSSPREKHPNVRLNLEEIENRGTIINSNIAMQRMRLKI